MRNTNILADDDFCEDSIYRSFEAEAKLANWCEWAERNLSKKRLLEIKRAMQKLNKGKL